MDGDFYLADDYSLPSLVDECSLASLVDDWLRPSPADK